MQLRSHHMTACLPKLRTRSVHLALSVILTASWVPLPAPTHGVESAASAALPTELLAVREFVSDYCVDCHAGQEAPPGELALNPQRAASDLARDDLSSAEGPGVMWERIVRRLRARQMPPPDAVRPTDSEYQAILRVVETRLDQAAEARPSTTPTASLRRLTRTEYGNAIRDLLALDIEADTLLPADPESHGFDNVTVGELSPTLMDRYLSAAQLVSQAAVGRRPRVPHGATFRIPPDQTQVSHVDGLPLGTRGGGLFSYLAPATGKYEIQIRLTRDRDEHVEGLNHKHEIHVLVDRALCMQFTVVPPAGQDYQNRDDTKADSHLRGKLTLTAGPHAIGVTFPAKSESLAETRRQPFDAAFNRHRHPRPSPAVFEVSLVGPLDGEPAADGPLVQTPSQRRLGLDELAPGDESAEAADHILRPLLRRAYRRPIDEADLRIPRRHFRAGLNEQNFAAGVERALASVLVNPHFLFRVETPKPVAASGEAYPVSGFELASRLSFFLWSSIPDDQLLACAEGGTIHQPEVLRQQVARMLRDERSRALSTNFADQWLHLRNLASFSPNLRKFPDFDDNLRRALRHETHHVFDYLLREDRSLLELINGKYSFLNQRLAQHYGVRGVLGSHFRLIQFDSDSERGGLLRHGGVLAVTSYATRTSPTIRGNWVLDNLLGTPAPPPPPNVPPLDEKEIEHGVSLRQRLAEHRSNPACAVCHDLMDPIGFALENFDATGRWREFDEDLPIDASGRLPDGTHLAGVNDLEAGLLERPEVFIGTVVEKLLTYALGRGIESVDAPAVRKIVREAAAQDYRMSAIITSVAQSVPFRMKANP